MVTAHWRVGRRPHPAFHLAWKGAETVAYLGDPRSHPSHLHIRDHWLCPGLSFKQQTKLKEIANGEIFYFCNPDKASLEPAFLFS